VRTYGELGSDEASPALFEDLMSFARDADPADGFTTFLAAFPGAGSRKPSEVLDEHDFERRLWRQLRSLRRIDGAAWDPAVSSDPSDDHFGFSLGGTAFFVVGLHPGASRKARQSQVPVLVFNLHEQFDRLRADARFETFRDTIRRRDLRLQGSLNPMVADHGSASEARQYSGRAVAKSWRAPFPRRCPHDEGRTPTTRA
jgi:FPC/CPF motif-containing protein YcgG